MPASRKPSRCSPTSWSSGQDERTSAAARGRLPDGNKWSFLPKGVYPRYLVCNADESEPGCFKDRYLIEKSPHQVTRRDPDRQLAIGCNLGLHLHPREYLPQHERWRRHRRAREAGYLGKTCWARATTWMSSCTGGRVLTSAARRPRSDLARGISRDHGSNAFPAVRAVRKTTIVNNVATVAPTAIVIQRAGLFKAMGTPTGAGPASGA